jgi:hypothetical protein
MPYSARIASICLSDASQTSFLQRPTVLSSKNKSGSLVGSRVGVS